jgi:DHA1 family inner membrane transport protein
VFASTIFTRAVDPVIPKIAADLSVDVTTAALLSTVYTFPYALVQPVLGAIADFFGKTRLMNISLLIVSLAALVCATAQDFPLLVAMRVVAGLVAGGIFPVALALVGDLVPIAAFLALRRVVVTTRGPFSFAALWEGFRSVFADPRAKVCFGSVFLEAVFIHGLFPYVALLLVTAGETSASIAGLVIAAFGIGGVVYSLSVPALVAALAQNRLMIAGGALASASLALVAFGFPWYVECAVFAVLGFGFYLLHGSIQVHVTELSDTARGVATSLHSCFFYLGQATGPLIYAYGFAHAGEQASLFTGAVVVMAVGLVCARLLRHRAPVPRSSP